MNDYRLNWNPPAEPLGAAIDIGGFDCSEAAQQAYAERHFEGVDYDFGRDRDGVAHIITEQDCRQIKGAKGGLSNPPAKSPAVAAPPQGWVPKIGDRVRIIIGCRKGQQGVIREIYNSLHIRPDVPNPGGEHPILSYGLRELEPLTTSPSNAGWIEHDGGKCPDVVKNWPGKFVIRFADGAEADCDSRDANDGAFKNNSAPDCNVIAYRLIQD